MLVSIAEIIYVKETEIYADEPKLNTHSKLTDIMELRGRKLSKTLLETESVNL